MYGTNVPTHKDENYFRGSTLLDGLRRPLCRLLRANIRV